MLSTRRSSHPLMRSSSLEGAAKPSSSRPVGSKSGTASGQTGQGRMVGWRREGGVQKYWTQGRSRAEIQNLDAVHKCCCTHSRGQQARCRKRWPWEEPPPCLHDAPRPACTMHPSTTQHPSGMHGACTSGTSAPGRGCELQAAKGGGKRVTHCHGHRSHPPPHNLSQRPQPSCPSFPCQRWPCPWTALLLLQLRACPHQSPSHHHQSGSGHPAPCAALRGGTCGGGAAASTQQAQHAAGGRHAGMQGQDRAGDGDRAMARHLMGSREEAVRSWQGRA